MRILVVGGGSGGHITPAVAVVREVLRLKPRTKVEFWTDRKYYANVVKITTEIGVAWGEEERRSGKKQYIRVRKVLSGKFRRYSGWKLTDYLEHPWAAFRDLILLNIVGFLGFTAGIVQSFFRLLSKKTRPDVVFLKGGFVGLPVGIACRILKIPYVVHESDAVFGLANKLLVRKARVVATSWRSASSEDALLLSLRSRVPRGERRMSNTSQSGAPSSSHSIHADATVRNPKNEICVGIPVAPEFKKVSATRQAQLKKTFGYDPEKPLVVITGGSQGAQHINVSIREILPEMLEFTSVGLVAGRTRYEEMIDLKKYEIYEKAKLKSNFRMWAFNSAMYELLGAADVIISRAGATTIAEMAELKKAVILVPYAALPGGHQVKNAERLKELGAVEVIADEEMVKAPEKLLEMVRKLVRSPRVREELASKLHETAGSDAALKLANILLSEGIKG
ncbi:UDP-N-acetylglucosamine--N-acetylmuramyl-(pentapeptide) pyrophosphoryl-undecaprenol N-acetylglucosamine transferase [Candidatus Saccharibacteria bacterium]|nr:UDP-N-acetylglucosamine--N-acetylmuramyl-(pentapeptide) pyrophosphoryl-undecaprenol N-acetylglucosamine transferase [Candidatus Saccharibacteria bacterium]